MVLDDSIVRRSGALQEMLRLARSIVADGEVSELEAKVFQSWIHRHPDLIGVYPVSELVGILRSVFADGRLSKEESEQLKAVLEDVTGSA